MIFLLVVINISSNLFRLLYPLYRVHYNCVISKFVKILYIPIVKKNEIYKITQTSERTLWIEDSFWGFYENEICLQTIVFTVFLGYPYGLCDHRVWSQSPPINTFLNKNTYINLSIFLFENDRMIDNSFKKVLEKNFIWSILNNNIFYYQIIKGVLECLTILKD